jgi:ATP-dependent RNA helicase RhlE
MDFSDLGLIKPLLGALKAEGYSCPTPIQEQAIPPALRGDDIMGGAQTGTGKTAAFSLPIIQHLVKHPLPGKKRDDRHSHPVRALILSPTRELARQIDDRIIAYRKNTDLRSTVVHGGVKQGPQVKAIKKGVDILTATPGRLIDLMNQGIVRLKNVEIFVLDEVDRMLDMGFIDDIWRIVGQIPKKRQTLFFSATIPPQIKALSDSLLNSDRLTEVHINPELPAADTIDQSIYLVEQEDKLQLISHLLNKDDTIERALVFTRTKVRANIVVRSLRNAHINADVIHSDLPQTQRTRALENFKEGNTRVLIASDIAARGLDINDVSHVINFEMPQEPEMYIHRIGRTGRAGTRGRAISFCDIEERLYLTQIEELLGFEVEVEQDNPFASPFAKLKKQEKKSVSTAMNPFRRPGRRRRL